MKKYLLAAALVGALGIASFTLSAQDSAGDTSASPGQNQNHRKHGGKHHRQGLKKLNLTADQKTKLEPIFKSQHDQMSAIRKDSSLTQDQRRQKAMDLRKSTDEQMASVLTPEQQQQLAQMRQNRKDRFEQYKANHGSHEGAPQTN